MQLKEVIAVYYENHLKYALWKNAVFVSESRPYITLITRLYRVKTTAELLTIVFLLDIPEQVTDFNGLII
jgi:hypothetical protein